MTPAEERAQMRKGLSVLRADIDNWTATVDLSIKQAEDRLDAMAAEDASAAESESAAIVKALVASARNVVRECRAGSSEEYRALGDLEKTLDAMEAEATQSDAKPEKPQTFEERVGVVPSSTPWAIGQRVSDAEARWVICVVNNWDRIIEVLGLARRVVGNAERMEDPKALAGLALALAALDEAEVVT